MLIDYLINLEGDNINFSDLIIPIMVLFVIIYGIIKKVNVYDVFVNGAKEGMEIGISIFPCLLGMILAINILVKSNVLSIFFIIFKPLFTILNLPMEILPLAFLRPISGSASLSILNSLLQNYGPDSFVGRLSSVIQGSTDTTIYVLTLYFGSVGIKKIRHAAWAGLIADLAGIIASIVVISMIF